MDYNKYHYDVSIYEYDLEQEFGQYLSNLERDGLALQALTDLIKSHEPYSLQNSLGPSSLNFAKHFRWPGIKIHLSKLSLLFDNKVIFVQFNRWWKMTMNILYIYKDKYKIIKGLGSFKKEYIRTRLCKIKAKIINDDLADDDEMYLT